MNKLAMVSVYPSGDVIRGGVEGVTYNLSLAFEDLGDFEIHILAPAIDREPGTECRGKITIHWLPVPRVPGFISYWTSYRKIIHRKLYEIGPDITHFQGVAGWSLNYKRPYVLTVHGINENDVLYSNDSFKRLRHYIVKNVEKRARCRTSDVIIISRYVKQEIGSHICGTSWDIENPVSPEFFEIPRDVVSPVILYVGRINARKNVENLILSFKDVVSKQPDAQLHLAGPGDPGYLARCKDLVDRESLQDSVYFLGSLDRKSLMNELSHASCLALVSHQETAPMVIEEAMAAGIPVVASRLCGIPYMIDDGVTGYLVDQDDIDDISQKLGSILGDKTLRENMSDKCKEVAIDRFHSYSVARKTMDVYESVLGN